jgi:hypothetical protein
MNYIQLAPANIQKMVGSIFPTGLLRPDKSGLAMTARNTPHKNRGPLSVCIKGELRLKYGEPCV